MDVPDFNACQMVIEDDLMYRLLVDNANEAIYIAQDGIIRYANPKSEEISGYYRHELQDRPLMEIIHPEDRQWVLQRHMLRLEGKKLQSIYSHRIIDKSGHVRWLEVNPVRVLWRGSPAVLIFATDISERKRVEDALRESEQRYRSLFYSIPSGVFYYDNNLHIIEANERFASAFGRPGVSLINLDLKTLYDQRIISCLSMPLKGLEGRYEGGFRVGKRYKELWLFVNTLPVYRANGDLAGGIGMFQDMTERKKTELMLKKKEEELTLKSRHLEEANTALHVVLRHSEENLLELQKNILSNIDEMIMPLVKKLRMHHSDDRLGGYVDLIRMNLREIASPFLRNMAINHYNLTKQERQIAGLIREGMKTNEIAAMLALSRRSVEHHRYKIRNKMGLRRKKANLRTLLLSLSQED